VPEDPFPKVEDVGAPAVPHLPALGEIGEEAAVRIQGNQRAVEARGEDLADLVAGHVGIEGPRLARDEDAELPSSPGDGESSGGLPGLTAGQQERQDERKPEKQPHF
jgi:hypothetical protein